MNEEAVMYQQAVTECIAYLEQLNFAERSKIETSLAIGLRINELLLLSEDKEKTLKRLSQDITRQRGKLTPEKKLLDCQQLYIDFASIDNVDSYANKIINEMTLDLLLKDGKKQKKELLEGDEAANILKNFQKITKTLDRISHAIDITDNIDTYLPEMTLYADKISDLSKSITYKLYNYQGPSQVSLFSVSAPDLGVN